jgi:serine/threonine protein kinase
MALPSGARLGPYEVVSPLGAGGMGEVYRGRDTRLDRSVAIKILPGEFAQNAQRRLRFEREAKTISQLNHPNICTLYDVGENYLVMELLEGESLAERIWKGPLPPSDVLKYGTQIAEALGKAHREGVIHRDLKPGNVMITRSGAKLLDFGLAKNATRPALVDDLTLQKPLTEEGQVVGTFQYMAPEQLAGEEPDARTDIFALGCVLYEMATGKRAFEGKTRTSLIAAIIGGEPAPMTQIQPLTPPALEHVVRKCLAKDREDRWQSATDIAEQLRWMSDAGSQPGTAAPIAWRRRMRERFLFALVAVLASALVVVGTLYTRAASRKPRVIFSQINPPQHTNFFFENSTAVLSPDGRKIAFVAKGADGTLLRLRSLDSETAVALSGTEQATFPFWSPDSQSLGFFADGKLKRISVNGGGPQTLADAPLGRGGSWNREGTIIFAPTAVSGIFRVAANGGDVREVTRLDPAHGISHRFPAFLPDGRHFVAFVQGVAEGANVLLASLDSKESRLLIRADVGATFAAPNFILFMTGGTLRVQRLDPKTWQLAGDSKLVAQGVMVSSYLSFMNVSASDNGLLAYVTGNTSPAMLRVIDKHGKETATIGPPADQLDPRIAPDGHALVVTRFDSGLDDIWSIDLRRNVETRLTFSPAHDWGPVWSPDSKSIVYTSFDRTAGDLLIKRVDGSESSQPLLHDDRRKVASDWSRDGKMIIYHHASAGTSWDIEAYSIADRKSIPLVTGPASETAGHLSPDGRWLAYISDVSGKEEIYVQPFPVASEKWQVSSGGGFMPAWSRDGRELYYCAPDGKLMAAAVHTEHGFLADAPRPLFNSNVRIITGVTRNQYDVMPDGKFLINTALESPNSAVTLVQNWMEISK